MVASGSIDFSELATAEQGAKADTALQPEDVINNLTTTDDDAPLSATQGKALQDNKANITQEAWTAVTSFSNGWIAVNQTLYPVGYMKDTLGFVHLRGLVQSGTYNTVAFILPFGYRPPYGKRFVNLSNGTNMSILSIATDGNLIPSQHTYAGWISLDGIVYETV
jgi:hypothetical protein